MPGESGGAQNGLKALILSTPKEMGAIVGNWLQGNCSPKGCRFESYLRSHKYLRINKMRGGQVGCHFYFGRVAVLVAVREK
jgi:hypothetical protein